MEMTDLGHKMGEPCCGPEPSDEGVEAKKYYPTLYVEDVELDDLPDEGTAVIKFKVERKTVTMDKTKDGKRKRTTYSLEIKSIGGYKEDDSEPGEALDRLRDEVEDED